MVVLARCGQLALFLVCQFSSYSQSIFAMIRQIKAGMNAYLKFFVLMTQSSTKLTIQSLNQSIACLTESIWNVKASKRLASLVQLCFWVYSLEPCFSHALLTSMEGSLLCSLVTLFQSYSSPVYCTYNP